jgi:hypothetical protein
MTTFSDPQIMLTLAALTYRGFQDALGGRVHAEIVTGAVLDGLQTLAPVKCEWELVWGPATDRAFGLAIDTNMMYVVRSRRAANRLVVAIRGTNPLSLPDWVFGDFWVGETVAWPYATDNPAVISKSTALGLSALQAMRSSAPAVGPISEVSALVAGAFAKLERAVRGGPASLLAATPARLDSLTRKIGELWLQANANPESFRVRRLNAPAVSIAPDELRSKLEAQARPDGSQALLTFLRAQAERSGATPLEVVVTGHSKGGALAQTAAVWLKDALDSAADPAERWDANRGASVACYAFAGPTPGNTGFAKRIERTLGQNHHHLRNMHDIVTRAWQVDELDGIPALYGARTAVFTPLVKLITDDVAKLDYRHAQLGVTPFEGKLGNGEAGPRDFATEFVYQHLDAYLEETKLHDQGIRAATFFL